jgi:hypothetical protein
MHDGQVFPQIKCGALSPDSVNDRRCPQYLIVSVEYTYGGFPNQVYTNVLTDRAKIDYAGGCVSWRFTLFDGIAIIDGTVRVCLLADDPGCTFTCTLRRGVLHSATASTAWELPDLQLWDEPIANFSAPWDSTSVEGLFDSLDAFGFEGRRYALLPRDWKHLPPDSVPPLP